MRRGVALVLVLSFAWGQEGRGRPFRIPARYEIELLYVVHKRLTRANCNHLESAVAEIWPGFDRRKLTPSQKQIQDYFRRYRDRLLGQAGTSWARIMARLGAGSPPDARLVRLCNDRAFEIVEDQLVRELRTRGVFVWLRDQAAKEEMKSLTNLYDTVRKKVGHRDLLTRVPGWGAIVCRSFPAALLELELETIEDSGVVFGPKFRSRIVAAGEERLPRVGSTADLIGSSGQGRVIWRLIRVNRDPMAIRARRMISLFREGVDKFEGKSLTGARVVREVIENWDGWQRPEEETPEEAIRISKMLPHALRERYARVILIPKEDRYRASVPLVKALTHKNFHVREAAIECLKSIYGRTLLYRPHASPSARKQKQKKWKREIEKLARP
jgi:hypothetical protein